MAHKTTNEENYSGITEEGFEAYSVAFNEITQFVRDNRGTKLDLTIRFEDFLEVRNQFSKVLEELCGLELPEKSLMLRLPIGLTHFEDEKLSGKYPFSEVENSLQTKLSFIYKIVLPPTFKQAIRFEKRGVLLVVPSTLNYIVAQDFSRGEAVWNNGKNGYETYAVEQKYVELNEYTFVFDNITASYKSAFDAEPLASSPAPVACAPKICAPNAISPDHILCGKLNKGLGEGDKVTKEEIDTIFATVQDRTEIDAAVFAPPAVFINKPFVIHIVIVHHKDFDEICTQYTTLSDKSAKQGNKSIRFAIPASAKIDINLVLKKARSAEIVHSETISKTWKNQNIEEDFRVIIPQSYSETQVSADVEILVNGEPACKMLFEIGVVKTCNEILNNFVNFLNTLEGKRIIATVSCIAGVVKGVLS